ncbi:MAG: GreA/GreB family elongation factor [Phycisphaerales bacterium]|nr:GreA/GreB family elongation factor [Phycisphaerales bacterium]
MAVMQLESLVQLAGAGNKATVEEEWLKLIEADHVAPTEFCRYAGVLSELVRKGDTAQAEALAWSAIEMLGARSSPRDTVAVAGAMLLALKDSDGLRKESAGLYRKAFAEREGLDALLSLSGLEGGRPVRRALRTLDVCLSISPGSYVHDRHDPVAARVDAVDSTDWTIRFVTAQGRASLGCVEFADRFEPAEPDSFRVLKQFSRDELLRRLDQEPGAVIEDLCRKEGGEISSDQLEELLTADLLAPGAWKKWWTRARAALKNRPNIRSEGRSPVTLVYDPKVKSIEDGLLAQFDALRDSKAQWDRVEQYLRECKLHKKPPSDELLKQFYARFESAAERHIQAGARIALREALLARRCAALLSESPSADLVPSLLRDAKDPVALLHVLDDEKLLREAYAALRTVRPADYVELFAAQLLTAPADVCDELAGGLIEAGWDVQQFKPMVDKVLASPLEHHEALLWLFDGPAQEAKIHSTPPLTLLTRVLGVMTDLKRDGMIGKDEINRVLARSRSTLALRKYERFVQATTGLELGMAQALRTQIRRLEGLGKVVQQDLLSELSRRYTFHEKAPDIPLWLRPDVLFVTSSGMSRRQAELEHHVNVKMKENARAIGAAAEMGDLSENSEYKFALEERDLLRAQLARMNEEMSKAKVIDPASVPVDSVGIGSRVRLKNAATGEEIDMTFVGPWDADLATHRYNYLAPFAQQMMGKTVGDRIEIDLGAVQGQFEVLGIENGLT